MVLSNLAPVLLLLTGGLVGCQAQVNVTLTCLTCTTYNMNLGTVNITMSCPAGTVCSIPAAPTSALNTPTSAPNTPTSAPVSVTTTTTAAPATSICSASNTCNNIICDHYAVFPSPTNCQQFYICRYNPGRAAYVLSNFTCPGASRFNVNTGKCTLSASVVCFTTTNASG